MSIIVMLLVSINGMELIQNVFDIAAAEFSGIVVLSCSGHWLVARGSESNNGNGQTGMDSYIVYWDFA